MAKKLLNPRGYLSWTQVDMWLRSPYRYERQYFHGDAGFENPGMTYGKKASDALENGAEDEDTVMEALVALLPRHDTPEHEIMATMTTDKGTVDLLGKLDTFNSKTFDFREYKTGVTKWTQTKAEKHKQLMHYATLIWLTKKKIPKEVWLDWAQTDWYQGEIVLTGHIQSFRVKITMQDILEYMALVSKVAKEIDEAYRKHLTSLT